MRKPPFDWPNAWQTPCPIKSISGSRGVRRRTKSSAAASSSFMTVTRRTSVLNFVRLGEVEAWKVEAQRLRAEDANAGGCAGARGSGNARVGEDDSARLHRPDRHPTGRWTTSGGWESRRNVDSPRRSTRGSG